MARTEAAALRGAAAGEHLLRCLSFGPHFVFGLEPRPHEAVQRLLRHGEARRADSR